MFKNKRTKVTLIMGGCLVVIAAGIFTYGIFSGRFSSSADFWAPRPAGSIQGTITDKDGKPISGARAFAYDLYIQQQGTAIANSSGYYKIYNLSPKSYVMGFAEPKCHYPDPVPTVQEEKMAESFTVHANETVTRNGVLQEWPWIKGQVKTSSGAGNPGVTVGLLIHKSLTDTAPVTSRSTTTDSKGYYKFSCLQKDRYYSLIFYYAADRTVPLKPSDVFKLTLPGKPMDIVYP